MSFTYTPMNRDGESVEMETWRVVTGNETRTVAAWNLTAVAKSPEAVRAIYIMIIETFSLREDIWRIYEEKRWPCSRFIVPKSSSTFWKIEAEEIWETYTSWYAIEEEEKSI